jgi:glycosyltransferase involved in cell wall biosynthesis
VKPLRVAFETQFVSGTPTGLGVYAANLAVALRARSDVDVIELREPGYDVWRFDRRVYWDQLRAPLLARRANPDIVHFTGGTLPLWMPHPCVVTLHDLAWLHGAVAAGPYAHLYFGTLQGGLARHADRIAADTLVARDEIAARLGIAPSRIAVTGAGVDASWFELTHAPAEPPYVLSVGTVEERKGLITAVRALAALPTLRLISVGPQTSYAARVRQAAAEAGVTQRVELRGYVDDTTLRALYAGASALVFPSRYEGFGLPPLQALAAGVPVVASDIPVLREVLGDCGLFAPVGDEQGFAERLRSVLAYGAGARELLDRGRLHARGYAWAAVAERTVHLYNSLVELGEKTQTRRSRR